MATSSRQTPVVDSGDGVRGRARVPAVPVPSLASSLPPTAQKILLSAKELLAAEGLGAFTLEAVTNRAGVNKALVRYYFGDKAGLIEAVVDEIVLDACASMASDITAYDTPAERIDGFIDSVRYMAQHVDSYSGFFDVFPHALRDHKLRQRLVYLYSLWFEWNLEWLGLQQTPADAARLSNLKAMGPFCAAVIDGVSIQALIGGSDYDPEPTLGVLRRVLENMLTE